jgi:hyaluronan synthase
MVNLKCVGAKLWNLRLGQIFTLFAIAALIGPAIAGYVLKWDLRAIPEVGISVYAIHSIIHLVFQIVSAEINNYKMKKEVKNRAENWADIKVTIIVAGYREDAYMFEKCLRSIKESKYGNIARVICIIDGIDEADRYMADIYQKIFESGYKVVDFVLSEQGNREAVDFSQYQASYMDNVCIMQPHRGKREALYTASYIAMTDPSVQAIITTDSDTILEDDAIKELVYPLRHEDVGAVAGQVLVWNTDSLLTFIVSFRYWLSFNLERACESLWRTVLCIAGPMGCYKVELIRNVLDEWVHQQFLGNKCTYGDDRHLTNRILMQGKKVVYTPQAVGHTDTPYSFERYLVQQTRWSKSYFREFFFTIGCVHKHFIWMGYELVYHFTYFFLLMYWMIHLFYFADIRTQAIAVLVTSVMSLARSAYGAIKTRDAKFLMYNLYSYVYFFVIIPAKLMALMTMWDISWGTRGGSASKRFWSIIWSKFMTYFGLIIWTLFAAGGFGYSIYYSHIFEFNNMKYRTGFLLFMGYIGYIVVNVVIYIALNVSETTHTKLFKQIKEDKVNIRNQIEIVISPQVVLP